MRWGEGGPEETRVGTRAPHDAPLTNFPTPALTGSGSKGRHAALARVSMASQPPAGAPLVYLEKSRLRRFSRNISFVAGGKKRGSCRCGSRRYAPAAKLAATHGAGLEPLSRAPTSRPRGP